jgi:hypothetical protein
MILDILELKHDSVRLGVIFKELVYRLFMNVVTLISSCLNQPIRTISSGSECWEAGEKCLSAHTRRITPTLIKLTPTLFFLDIPDFIPWNTYKLTNPIMQDYCVSPIVHKYPLKCFSISQIYGHVFAYKLWHIDIRLPF